jgi:hypothetical protein
VRLALLVLVACTHAETAAPLENHLDIRLTGVDALTPTELPGVSLGMPAGALLATRPNLRPIRGGYALRDTYAEYLGVHNIAGVEYYCLKHGGPMYQISMNFADAASGYAVWNKYLKLGERVQDLGGDEIVVHQKFPFEVRIWTNGHRVQWMAVIEGSEWWSQYHPATMPP